VLATLAGGLAWCSLWFNPVVKGGSEYLVENPLSQRILAIDREAGGETLWVSYGSHQIANLFRVLGIRALNGVHPLPQLELWERFDTERRYRRVYNRYAHVSFQPSRSSRISFRLDGLDGFTVLASPTADSLRSSESRIYWCGPGTQPVRGAPGIERLDGRPEPHLEIAPRCARPLAEDRAGRARSAASDRSGAARLVVSSGFQNSQTISPARVTSKTRPLVLSVISTFPLGRAWAEPRTSLKKLSRGSAW
jgi:hypothetical protein